MAKAFEELDCWKLAIELDTRVYKLVTNGAINGQYALREQMLKSVGSIADNIAEGFERGGNKEFIQFLFIAKGSCGELRSQFHRAGRRELINQPTFEKFYEECKAISAKISNLISYLKKSELKGNKYTT